MPPLVEYDQEFLDEAAAQIEALPEGSPVVVMIGDYAVTRAQIRAAIRALED